MITAPRMSGFGRVGLRPLSGYPTANHNPYSGHAGHYDHFDHDRDDHFDHDRDDHFDHDRDRDKYRNNYNPYFYAYGNQFVPNYVGYPFGFDSLDSGDSGPGYAQQDNGASAPAYAQDPQGTSGPPDNGGYADPPPSPPEIAENQVGPGYRPEYQSGGTDATRPQPATTLVFKDGRPNAEVHNYVLTSTALYDLDGETRKEIPLSEINMQATEQANRSAGLDFALPEGN